MAFRQIAWGLVDITPSNFKALRRAARDELRSNGYSIIATTHMSCRLFKLPDRRATRRSDRRKQFVGFGTFEACCKLACKLIDTPKGNQQ